MKTEATGLKAKKTTMTQDAKINGKIMTMETTHGAKMTQIHGEMMQMTLSKS